MPVTRLPQFIAASGLDKSRQTLSYDRLPQFIAASREDSRRRDNSRHTNDRGFTLLEVIVALVLVALLALIFGQAIISGMSIYSDQVTRKDTHIDVRRTYSMFWHDMREWTDFTNALTGSTVDFHRYEVLTQGNQTYYGVVRSGMVGSGSTLSFKYDDGSGGWGNNYSLISSGVQNANALFTKTTAGTKDRINFTLNLSINNKPFRLLMTVFPRKQGG